MNATFSFQDQDVGTMTDAMRAVVSSAYAQKGKSVQIPSDVLRDSCDDLVVETTKEILAIRRHERAVSSKNLAFSFS